MLGVERYKVALVPHDENWADEYEFARDEIETILGDNIVEIHHVGSTAIKGTVAKPILDVAVVIKSVDSLNIADMEEASYDYVRLREDTGKYLFVRRIMQESVDETLSTHHIACYLEDNADFKATLLFCKYLNDHPEYAKRYNDLKIELASKYPDDRITYANAKSDFIVNVVALAESEIMD